MKKVAEKVFWKVFEAMEAIYAVTGAALVEAEYMAQEIFSESKDDPYWDTSEFKDK